MNTTKNIFSLFFFFLCASFSLNAQEEINLKNSSFEITPPTFGLHVCCKAPGGWFACGLEELNTPDVQPGWFGVDLPAAAGNYYLGMVTRDNDTWESVSQHLSSLIEKGKAYTFNMKISYSDALISMSRRTDEPARYNTPIKVRIWGGRSYCDTKELLAETSLIDHTYWKQYNFRFEPKMSHSFITIEAFYKTPTPIPYNGNVLIDDASPIIEIPIDSEPEPAIVDLKQPDVDVAVNISPSKTNTPTKVKPSKNTKTEVKKNDPDPPVAYKNEEKILKLDRKEMAEGQVIRIENLYFKADSAKISTEAYPVLDEIYIFLKNNPDISIEVGGHTNNRCETVFCDDLSEDRAKAVTDYLIEKGIQKRRLLFKGYGKRNPVATNETRTGRKRNQRVEIKILNLDG